MKHRSLICILIVLALASSAFGADVPRYLAGYEEQYAENPRAAALQWFKEAKLGLFVHYTLASLLDGGKPEYVKRTEEFADSVEQNKLPESHREKLGVTEKDLEKVTAFHNELMSKFTAEKFDAGAICDLAVAAEMKYVNFTTRHMGRLAMFRTKTTGFNSLNAPAGRDLVKELAEACAKRGLGLFLYVSTETSRTDDEYFEINRTLLTELLTQYGPIAGIWFDGIGKYRNDPENYTRLSEQFAYIRKLQPQCLISFKEGGILEEDFTSPEHFHCAKPVKWDTPERQARWEHRLERWTRVQKDMWEKYYKNLPVEINTVMQECYNRDGVYEPSGWINDNNARHLSADEVMFLIETAWSVDANLLMNIGPLGDGSIHPDDLKALKEVGKRIRAKAK